MIKDNQSLLIRAMKDTIGRNASLAHSLNESYHTAYEYVPGGSPYSVSSARINSGKFSIPVRPSLQQGLMPTLSSAPPSVATFSAGFLPRHQIHTKALDQEDNVADGVDSLLKGMTVDRDLDDDDNDEDAIEAEELTDADVETMIQNIETIPPITELDDPHLGGVSPNRLMSSTSRIPAWHNTYND